MWLRVGKISLVLLSLVGLVAVSVQAAVGGFSGGIVVTEGEVGISSSGDGSPMFTFTDARPGDSQTACIALTANGGGQVGLYGATTGTGLDQHLKVTVTRGQVTASDNYSCSDFIPDQEDYLGDGSGVIFEGLLKDYADSQTQSFNDPIDGAQANWSANEVHAYRYEVELLDDQAAQGLTAQQDFAFCIRELGDSASQCGSATQEASPSSQPAVSEGESTYGEGAVCTESITTASTERAAKGWSIRQARRVGPGDVVMKAKVVGDGRQWQLRMSAFIRRTHVIYLPLKRIQSVNYKLNGQRLGKRTKRPFSWYVNPGQIKVGENRFAVEARLKTGRLVRYTFTMSVRQTDSSGSCQIVS